MNGEDHTGFPVSDPPCTDFGGRRTENDRNRLTSGDRGPANSQNQNPGWLHFEKCKKYWAAPDSASSAPCHPVFIASICFRRRLRTFPAHCVPLISPLAREPCRMDGLRHV